MSRLTLTQNTRLTDDMERQLLREAMSAPQALNLLPAAKRAARRVARAVTALIQYADSVHQAMERSRLRSGFFAGAQW